MNIIKFQIQNQSTKIHGCSVIKLCLILWDPMDFSTPGFLVPHHLLEFAQVHVYWIGNAIQPSHPLPTFSQSFPASGSFPKSQLFTSNGQSTGTSASASVLPKSIQGWFPLRLINLIFLLPKGLSKSQLEASILQCSTFFIVQLSLLYMTTGKTTVLMMWTFVGKVMSLLFNTLSRFTIAFLPRNNCLLISRLQSPCTVILEPKKRKFVIASTFHLFPFYLPWSDGE